MGLVIVLDLLAILFYIFHYHHEIRFCSFRTVSSRLANRTIRSSLGSSEGCTERYCFVDKTEEPNKGNETREK